MFEPRGSRLRDERNPRGYLWKPLDGTIIGAQDSPSRILLAYNAEGTQAYVKACNKCQRFSNLIKQPSEELTPMMAPWPFAQWGLDIMGPFPMAVRQLKFLVVGIDYFTKWVEVEALATITEKNIRNFVWRNIICRYEIPRVLVSDNGKQFDNNVFRDFCSKLGIKNHYSSPAHPQANGKVEVTNRSLLKIIKTQLEGAKGI